MLTYHYYQAVLNDLNNLVFTNHFQCSVTNFYLISKMLPHKLLTKCGGAGAEHTFLFLLQIKV